MRLILIFIIILNYSCSISKDLNIINDNFSLKEDINKSIVDGFFNNDTLGISETIYLLK